MDWMQGIVGTICYAAVIFVAGALFGRPMWEWIRKALPWNY